jgi:hypothetical protein
MEISVVFINSFSKIVLNKKSNVESDSAASSGEQGKPAYLMDFTGLTLRHKNRFQSYVSYLHVQ